MNKILKRLLSVVLAVVMVVGLVPLSRSATVEAAGETKTIYFQAPDSWTGTPGIHMWDRDGHTNGGTPDSMTPVSGKVYKYEYPDNYESVIFTSKAGSWENVEKTDDLSISSSCNMYVYDTKSWTNYNESGSENPPGDTKTIYLDTRNYLPNGWNEAYIYLWINGTDNSGRTYKMNPVTVDVDGNQTTVQGLFSYDVPTEYTHLIFKPNQNGWEKQTANQTIPSDQRNLFTCTAFGNRTSGTWGVYTGTGSDNNFPSNVTGTVTFFDLYTDTEINALDNDNSNDPEYYGLKDWKYRVYGTGGSYSEVSASDGRSFTSIGRAFSNHVNTAISSYWNKKNKSVYPLYFGNFQPFYMIEPQTKYDENAIFTIDPWWVYSNSYKSGSNTFDRAGYMNAINDSMHNFSWFLNRSIDTNNQYESDRYGAVTQGIVGDKLVNGNIVAKNTDIPLPQFNPEFYNSSSVGKMYQPMEFPFVAREINGATYYQFDSGVNGSENHDTVRINSDGTGLIYSDDEADVVKGITAEGSKSPGFFPFNSPEDSENATSYNDDDNKLNYGFGMKLEIEFTMDSDGKVKDKNGNRIPATFEFSGDDDVWIYVDGKLALDLGGSHGVAQGKIDFSGTDNTAKAVVQYVKAVNGQTNASDVVNIENVYEKKDYINQAYGQERTVNENISLDTNGKNVTIFDFDKSDDTEIHTLTIFYEERGMFESNFKATFNLEQPTVLKTTNTVNVDNVNPALQEITKNIADQAEFEYSLNTANGYSNSTGTPVNGKKYTTESGEVATYNNTMKLKDGSSATFTKQFDRNSELELIQTVNSNYSTSWTMSELSDSGVGKTIAASYQEGKDSLTVGDNRVNNEPNTAFKLANSDQDDESVPARVQIDYVQNPQTGGIAIQKEMEENVSSADVFDFKVTLSDIFGKASEEQTYDLSYDIYSSDGENSTIVRKDVIAEEGVVSIKAGQFALIDGIPVGTKYKVVESEEVGYSVKGIDTTTYYNNDSNVSGDLTSATVTGTVVADPESKVDMFVYTNGIETLEDSFLVEIGKENTLKVIPTEENDGPFLGDLEEINKAWTGSEANNKGIVFIADGKPYVGQDNKPILETNVSGVTYNASFEEGVPVIKVTPGADDVNGAEKISVQYQLVELNEDGTVKYNQVEDPTTGETVSELAKITSVITATNYLYKANDDVYVLDYGLDVDLADRSAGSGMFENDVLENPSLSGSTSTYWNTSTGNSSAGATAEVDMQQNTGKTDGDHGSITPAGDANTGFAISNSEGSEKNPKVIYSMGEFLSDKDYYNYNVMVNRQEDPNVDRTSNRYHVNLTSNVTVMPANVVYYEDNFNSDAESTDSSAKIIYSGTSAPAGTSLELTQSNGQIENYGHDDAYASGTTDSAGSSTALTADGYNTKAEFTFTGSGFDVVARTTTKTAGIIYMIQKYDSNGGTWSDVKFGAVDTYYANGDLYQIPVIHEDLGETAKYKVTLTIRKTENESSVVYLDGIRIYNPMGASGNTDYIENEKGVTFEKVSDLILGNGTITETGVVDEYGSVIQGQTIEGSRAALMDKSNIESGQVAALGYTRTEDSNADAVGSSQTNSILQYLHSGPNNEIYLNEYASIALVAEGASSDSSTLQIEAKLVNIDGQSEDIPVSDGVDLNVWNGTELVKQDTVTSSTAMYYTIDLKDCINLGNNSYLVVISGNSDIGSENPGTSCLSFSNLKYKGYTLSNPLDEKYSNAVAKYIDTSNLTGGNKFVDFTGNYPIRKSQWVPYKYRVTLTEDVFGGDDPKFTMYYTNNGKKEKITVTARRVNESVNKYDLRFKAPNAVGNFPIEIHYIDNEGKESADFLATSMKVIR